MSLNLDKSTWKRVAFGDVVRNVNETVRDADAAGIDRDHRHGAPGPRRAEDPALGRRPRIGTTFTRRVKPGQTLFGKRRAYQRKVAYAEFDGDLLRRHLHVRGRRDADCSAEFLPFLVQSNEFFDHALDTSAGSLSPRTNWRDLANFEFDLPPLDEQKRIADLLWALERHRACGRRRATRRWTGSTRHGLRLSTRCPRRWTTPVSDLIADGASRPSDRSRRFDVGSVGVHR